ncbi:amino acid/amide ABC transporter membrane protein 1, HAAT family [Thermaerobacter marianensis DSM 12885]|uniref:Amino acid/amide ABC transporter membrane protein 1, HAAT family n=1 Tax=Thermaerobacter marianensis (strain ATCC 700841 / DSM 12885 / JCM 10246 / 7p75a) TaxID=644966 RepID=E6SHD1_THEM7|nr:branched-chain amino acid ABC transporter permease [Thermaerobacter marianensis]ADU50695.1 amino acid/amide ABC transporter membrane protein 1, HAAT family [Thermaerobacter marianensis DSM 12885]
MLVQQVVNGLTVGSIYALVALGYTMVFGVLKMINFAHGDLFALGAYLGLTFLIWGALGQGAGGLAALLLIGLLAALCVGLAGVLVERVAYRPLRGAGRLPAVVSALGVSVFIQNGIMLLWGAFPVAFPHGMVPDVSWSVGGITISLMRLVILGGSLVLMLALYLFIQYTKLGAAMRAIAVDHETARLMGIDVDRLIQLVFLLGAALGGLAGVMVGLYYGQLNFTMGWLYGLKAFTAAILGGIGNIPGAMVGGLVLGLAETLAAGYVAGEWKDAVAFFILILILLVRPTGLLGERVAEKI